MSRDRITPVIAGAAQVANKDEERLLHPVELIGQAARLALDEAGVAPDRVGGVLATPLTVFDTDNAAELVAERLGLAPGLRVESTYSGAAPQALLAQACREVAAGALDAVLVVGGIADASVRRARQKGVEPPAPPTSVWSQGSKGVDHQRVRQPAWRSSSAEGAAGASLPSAIFALAESALAAGVDPAVHRARLGEMLAPFTAAAARRPDVAWFPEVRSAAEISTVTDDNRLVAEPYTKRMCSFPTVDLAAAVVVSASRGDGSPEVRPLSLVTAHDPLPPSARAAIDRSVALDAAVEEALRLAGIEQSAIDFFDLYSCFPAAVQLAANALGLTAGDERPRSIVGGLPYFGGPGASYSLHSIVSTVEELRARPDAIGAVVGVGGMVGNFSVGIYAVDDRPVASVDLGSVDGPSVETVATAEGRGVIEAGTVLHDRDDGPVAAPAVVRLPDGTRVGAKVADASLPAALSGKALVGREVVLTTVDGEVRYTLA